MPYDHYDAGMSAAAEILVGIVKRVIVSAAIYSHLLEFLHVDIQSTGCTLSRPWSRQPNDVMAEIECVQLHSELFRCRHLNFVASASPETAGGPKFKGRSHDLGHTPLTGF